MRVLHVVPGNLFGGIETAMITWAKHRHLAPDMHPEYALCFPGRLRDELQAIGVPVHDLGPVRLRRPWEIIRARWRLARLLRSGYDAVAMHGCWQHAIFAPVVRRFRVPVVHWLHAYYASVTWRERIAARTRPDWLIAVSQCTLEVGKKLFPNVPGEIVYHPVPPIQVPASARTSVRAQIGTPMETVVILCACRLEIYKGQRTLLHALRLLPEELGWECWVAGDIQKSAEMGYLTELRALAAPLGERVRFLGERRDVPELMVAADIYCQPNDGPEPFGLSFVEALSAGRPVVSTRIGGAAEIVTAECGVLVEPKQHAELAAVLNRLISQPVERQRLGAAGPARAAELCHLTRQMQAIAASLRRGIGTRR